MNQQAMLERIAVLLARFPESVRMLNHNGEFSINTHAENVLINILNVLFDTEFENVNYSVGKQYPSIDLRDKRRNEPNHNSVAIQVTSDESLSKVTDCLETFIKHRLDKEYASLYIVMLVRKQNSYSKDSIDRVRNGFPFDSKTNILDLADLYKMLNQRNNLDEIRTVLEYLESQFRDPPAYDQYWKYRSDLNDYDQSVTKQYRYVDISGYSPKINNLQVKVGLEDLYVNQILSIKEKDRAFEVPVSRLLMKEGKSVVLGDPGSGKSTLLKWMMYDICSHREYYPATIPVYIRCAVYAQRFLRDQIDLGAFILQTLNLKNRQVYEDGLANGHLLLLLDGLDEISDVSLRHDIVENINTFIAQNSECRVIATSRKIGYSETRLDANFSHYELQTFNTAQIYEFSRNWFKAVDEESYCEEDVQKFVKRLQDNRSVFRLATTPLLLMIICLIQHQGLTLPENRIDLYNIATSTLLENWVKKRSRYGKSSFSVKQLIGYLSPVAFFMQENCDDGLIREDDFRGQLFKVCSEKTYGKDDFQIEQDVDDIIGYIKEDAGFLQEVGTDGVGVGQFAFMHLTFQEYFSAIRFVTKWEKGMSTDELKEYVLAPYWNEVLVLAAEELYQSSSDPELGCERVSRFVNAVFGIEDSIRGRNRPLALIVNILGTGAIINIDLLKQIVDRLVEDGRYIDHALDVIDHGIANVVLVERIVRGFHEEPEKKELSRALMWHSDNPTILKLLNEILLSDNNAEKEILFNYTVVYPVAPIVKTKLFKESVSAFINETETPTVPIQYTRSAIADDDNATAEEIIAAIRGIKRVELQKQYAEDIHYDISMKDIKELRILSAYIKNEFPDIDCTSFDAYIVEQEEDEKLEFSMINSIELMNYFYGLHLFYSRETGNITVRKGAQVYILSEPYCFNELFDPKEVDARQFAEFVRLVIGYIKQGSIIFQNINDFEVYAKYSRHLEWNIHTMLHDNNVLMDYFFDSIGCSVENIRKYVAIFTDIAPYRMGMYDMTKRTSELDYIIHSSLSATEKSHVLAGVAIGRKYRKEVHSIVNEAIEECETMGRSIPYSVHFLMHQI